MEELTRGVWSGSRPSAAFEIPREDGDASLMSAISRGSASAFAELYDRTSPAVRTAVAALSPDAGQRDEVIAASYLEVWWLAGCHTGHDLDAVEWITGIARRRIVDAGIGGRPSSGGGTSPGYARLELAALLRRPADELVRD
jgi:hypothetical protein